MAELVANPNSFELHSGLPTDPEITAGIFTGLLNFHKSNTLFHLYDYTYTNRLPYLAKLHQD
jgi:hypothetical protein